MTDAEERKVGPRRPWCCLEGRTVRVGHQGTGTSNWEDDSIILSIQSLLVTQCRCNGGYSRLKVGTVPPWRKSIKETKRRSQIRKDSQQKIKKNHQLRPIYQLLRNILRDKFNDIPKVKDRSGTDDVSSDRPVIHTKNVECRFEKSCRSLSFTLCKQIYVSILRV